LGYTKLVIVSQSPSSAAIEILAERRTTRMKWQSLIIPGTPEFQVIFENDDLSIRLLAKP
jgi:hypothetical protein